MFYFCIIKFDSTCATMSTFYLMTTTLRPIFPFRFFLVLLFCFVLRMYACMDEMKNTRDNDAFESAALL